RPHRNRRASLAVPAATDVANTQPEALRAVIVGESRQEPAVGADLQRAEAEIVLALGLDRLVEDDFVGFRRSSPLMGEGSGGGEGGDSRAFCGGMAPPLPLSTAGRG